MVVPKWRYFAGIGLLSKAKTIFQFSSHLSGLNEGFVEYVEAICFTDYEEINT